MNRCIADADSIINSYLRPKYDVPVDSPPNILKELSISISTYNLYKRRASTFSGCPDWVRINFEDAMAMLKEIRKGNMHLDIEPQPAASSAEIAHASTTHEHLFTSTTLEDW